jgi:small conductance mechanosensitive channel
VTFAAVDPEQLQQACGDPPGWMCEKVYDVTGSESFAKAAHWVFDTPLHILLIVVLAIVGNRVLRRGIRKFGETLRQRSAPSVLGGGDVSVRAQSRIRTVEVVLRSLATATVYTIAVLSILGELGVNLAPLIASAGLIGAGIAFGAQSLVKDMIAGLFILIEDQLGVGDVVDLGEASGTVEEVTLRTTRLRDVNGTVWYVPNGQVVRVGNKSQLWARAVLDTQVVQGSDLALASQVIGEIAMEVRQDERWRDQILEDPEVWGVESVDPAGVSIRLVMKTEPASQLKVLRELRARINAALREAGIGLPGVPLAGAAPALAPTPPPTTPPA